MVHGIYVFKYESGNLIIFYCYTYSGLLDITEVVIWNSIELIRNAEFGFQEVIGMECYPY